MDWICFSNTAMSIDDYEEYFKKKFVDGFAEEYEVQMGNMFKDLWYLLW